MMFKKEFLPLILSGRKIQTMRTHTRLLKVGNVYSIQVSRTKSTGHYVKITRRYRQSLGEITEEEAYLEGFDSLANFKQKWISIYGSWEPAQEVVVYEFTVIEAPATLQKRVNDSKEATRGKVR